MKRKYKRLFNGMPFHQYLNTLDEKTKQDALKEYKILKRREYMRNYMKSPNGKKLRLKAQLKKYYGTDINWYESVLKYQNHTCAICGSKYHGQGSRFVVDHDHDTGILRGMLCHQCNLMLGHCKDNIYIMMKMIEYLMKY